MRRTYLLLDYAGGVKRLYAGNDHGKIQKIKRDYRRSGWIVHTVRACSFGEAVGVLEDDIA
jgi:hypothetical protein